MKLPFRRFLPFAPLLLLTALAFTAPPVIGTGVAAISDKAASPDTDQKTFDTDIRPVLAQYCVSCHGAIKPPGGINVDQYHTVAEIRKDPSAWRKILNQLREKTMPPSGMPQPSDTQRAHLCGAIDDLLNSVAGPPDPGHVVLHRLNRTEYNNTIRDLVGVDTHPADSFPADGSGGGGFDNNSDTLFLPTVLMERYLRAAGEILAVAKPERLFPVRPSKKITPRAAARTDLERLATRAFRRPLDTAEVNRLILLYDAAVKEGANFEAATRFAMKGVLVSPKFLYRVEQSQNGDAVAHPLDDYALASRLSYFLWSSMPDDTLFRLAGQKKLHNPAVLQAQAERMLADPKSHALADGFAGQWLRVRELYSTALPDPGKFPAWNPALRDALYQEPVLLFDSIVRDDGSVLQLLDSNYTFLNETLAKFYGIPGVVGPQMRKVDLPDHKRGGVLTMGAVLTLTSYPQRTSPVLRGKWVLEQVLGAPAPPPPANVATLNADDKPNKAGLTFRQRLEQHRSKKECAGCHSRMDPLGFGLENFDAIGRWRTDIAGLPVDASGVLTTGEKFSGPEQLKVLMLARKDDFARNLSEKMLSYALGRGLEDYDLPAVARITKSLEAGDYRSGALIGEIVKSYPFLYRKG